MQPIPLRLVQAIRATFQASKPPSRPLRKLLSTPNPRQTHVQPCVQARIGARPGLRFYSDNKKDIGRKIEDAKSRIDETFETRADHVNVQAPKPGDGLPSETIVHTNPEASSIVHARPSSAKPTKRPPTTGEEPPVHDGARPSSTSPLLTRLSHLMDNFQSNLFVASRRLNDLTGYTDIERLKGSITEQEDKLTAARTAIQTARAKYAAAIATRSTTQREVNDLLHRKHTWSPSDLERFTNLYRSDHANEKVEETAQQELSRAESGYEEASTKLARTILARYHEEQIWSDKIRQMSTWGTWGLMGLNVLLFVLFQIAIEPWRRRRLVSGFEEKVQLALKEVGDKAALAAKGSAAVNIVVPEKESQSVADSLASAIVDAVSGTEQPLAAQSESPVKAVDAQETLQETRAGVDEDFSFPKPVIGETSDFATGPAAGYAYYQEAFVELFSERKIVVTQKELTTVALEGAAGGAALMGLLIVILRAR